MLERQIRHRKQATVRLDPLDDPGVQGAHPGPGRVDVELLAEEWGRWRHDRFIKATPVQVLEQGIGFVKAGHADGVAIDRKPSFRLFDHPGNGPTGAVGAR